jgi:hypothetical protein
METLIHVMHIVTVKDAHAWSAMSPAQLSMIGFWNLILVWLKVSPKSRDLQQALIFARSCSHGVSSAYGHSQTG